MSKLKTCDEFIKQATEKHNSKYDYSKVKYVNATTDVCIICPEHGEFWQSPHSHLKGCGCRICGKNTAILKRKKTTDEFVKQSKLIHGDKYDYSQVKYVNALEKVRIVCPIHGVFLQTPNIHLKGSGCEKCGGRFVKDTETFIEAARKVHGDKYDYSKSIYRNCKTKIRIICPEHGEFLQTSGHHLSGEGCSKCAITTPKAEKEIIDCISPIEVEQHNRKILNGKEIDLYIPQLKIGIEYNGLYWHSTDNGKGCKYHENKIDECNSNGVGLITIFEDEWLNKRKVCEYKLRRILRNINSQNGCKEQCIFKEIKDKKIINDFIMHNTLLESVSFSFAIGAFYDTELISLLVLKKYGDIFTIKCICSNIDFDEYNFEKEILDFFIENYTFKELVYFANKNWLCNQFDNFYTQHGFVMNKSIPPKSMYYNRKLAPYKRFSKEEYLNNEPNDINWITVWDCGTIKYSLKR